MPVLTRYFSLVVSFISFKKIIDCTRSKHGLKQNYKPD